MKRRHQVAEGRHIMVCMDACLLWPLCSNLQLRHWSRPALLPLAHDYVHGSIATCPRLCPCLDAMAAAGVHDCKVLTCPHQRPGTKAQADIACMSDVEVLHSVFSCLAL